MSVPNAVIGNAFKTADELNLWFQNNHTNEVELWVKVFKKSSGIESVTWDEIVIESLCWGWIDGIKKSIDNLAYLQRITPRKARSSWSKRNRAHALRLVSAGRMTAYGLTHVHAAQADGRWENAYAMSEMDVPQDFLDALETRPMSKVYFETLSKSSRYVIALGLMSAKKTATREKRFSRYLEQLAGKEPLS